jgi:lysophospholipase L1-like esterase
VRKSAAPVAIAASLALLLAACSSAGDPPGLYLALGDSLSEGVGASDRQTTAFVPLVHEGLGEGWELTNLGHSGDTSAQLHEHGHMDEAISLIDSRNADDDSTNDVRLVTLEIGGNDLLGLFFDLVVPGRCPTLEESLERDECVGALEDALGRFRPNLQMALDRLHEADPDLQVVLMTLYSPFSGDTFLATPALEQLGELALEGLPNTPFPDGLNDIIREEAEGRDVTLVDLWPLFEGKAGDYVAGDYIHPNDEGYRVMAEAVLEVVP